MSRPSQRTHGPASPRGAGRHSAPQPETGSSSPSAILRFALPASAEARVTVLGPTGGLIRVLRRDVLAAGEHLCAWDGRDDRGQRVPAGEYTLQLETAGRTLTSRVVSVR